MSTHTLRPRVSELRPITHVTPALESTQSHSTHSQSPTLQYQAIDLAVTVIGIYVCYIYYGALQEQLVTRPQPDGERFTYPLFLMLIQCICNSIFIYPIMYWQERRAHASGKVLTEFGPSTCKMRDYQYALLALTYLLGMQTSYVALEHISYPTQVLIKSCKMLPLVLMGTFVFGHRYSVIEYLAVTLITGGIFFFFTTGDSSNKHANGGSASTITGVVLSLVSLTCDGITGSGQDHFVSRYHPTGELLMFKMNFWSIFELLFACFILTDQGLTGLDFVRRHPDLLTTLLIFGFVSALGQCFIFHCVTSFGALPLSITTSTRKFFTILASVVYFGHKLNFEQWLAVTAVFAGLFVDVGKKVWSKKHKKVSKAETVTDENQKPKST